MNSITFRIDEEEVKSLADVTLSREEIGEILSMVENDPVLWSEIEKSIKGAIAEIKSRSKRDKNEDLRR